MCFATLCYAGPTLETKGAAIRASASHSSGLNNMMLASFINDPEHWLERAEQMRNFADELDDEQAKETMLRIANDYGRLAKRAEQRTKGLTSQ